MAILDKKTRILDVCLTSRGRELLAKNMLNFKYYCFSDEGIDYAGALSASIQNSSSIDTEFHKYFIFETDPRNTTKLAGNNEIKLRSYLYTVDYGIKSVPLMNILPGTGSVTLNRKAEVVDLEMSENIQNDLKDALAIVYNQTVEKKETAADEQYRKALFDEINQVFIDFVKGKNIVGRMLGYDWIFVNEQTLRNTVTGHEVNFNSVRDINFFLEKTEDILEKKGNDKVKSIEQVLSIDKQEFDFILKSENGNETKQGYLIEFFNSGSDGTYSKLADYGDKLTSQSNFDEYKINDVIDTNIKTKG